MNADAWGAAIIRAVSNAMAGDLAAVIGLAQQLAEEDEAKQLLRDAGFGYTGMSLLRTVEEVVARTHDRQVWRDE